MLPRRWEVSSFDLYTLAAQNIKTRPSPELMHLFLPLVSLEISVDADEVNDAFEKVSLLRAMLYIQGVATTLSPFATSHSLNSYAGINGRESLFGREKLHKGLRDGITTRDTVVEYWPCELSMMCIRGDGSLDNTVTAATFKKAVEASVRWTNIESRFPAARAIRSALTKAPIMPDMASSILHMWQALESLMRIDKEITYRVSLLLAELCSPLSSRRDTYAEAKKSYADRSKIAHGTSLNVQSLHWMRAWQLLCNTSKAILHRGSIPTAEKLTEELLAR